MAPEPWPVAPAVPPLSYISCFARSGLFVATKLRKCKRQQFGRLPCLWNTGKELLLLHSLLYLKSVRNNGSHRSMDLSNTSRGLSHVSRSRSNGPNRQERNTSNINHKGLLGRQLRRRTHRSNRQTRSRISYRRITRRASNRHSGTRRNQRGLSSPRGRIRQRTRSLQNRTLSMTSRTIDLTSMMSRMRRNRSNRHNNKTSYTNTKLRSQSRTSRIVSRSRRRGQTRRQRILLPILARSTLTSVILSMLSSMLRAISRRTLKGRNLLLLRRNRSSRRRSHKSSRPGQMLHSTTTRVTRSENKTRLTSRVVGLVERLFGGFRSLPFSLVEVSRHLNSTGHTNNRGNRRTSHLTRRRRTGYLSRRHGRGRNGSRRNSYQSHRTRRTLRRIHVLFVIGGQLRHGGGKGRNGYTHSNTYGSDRRVNCLGR